MENLASNVVPLRASVSEVPCEVGLADSSEDERSPNRSMSLPPLSAGELLNLFPQDAQSGYAPSFGCPHRPTTGSKSAKERAEQGARLATLAGRLRQKNFSFVPGEVAQDSSEAESHTGFLEEETAIILDWDDTIFPSTFVAEVVDPCTDDQESLPQDSPFLEQLHAHAIAVLEFLETARSLGRIGIVTLARRPWVLSSATKYLPWLDIEDLLRRYQIPVVYARECLKPHMIRDTDSGINVWTQAKHAAMKKALKKLKGQRPWKNILSIGDSTIEKNALIELRCASWSDESGESGRVLFKTVKLLDEPTPDQFVTQLSMLQRHFWELVQKDNDFDFSCDE
eukprot:TRINITY_DN59128_c0_g1_i1.p1 TRINITY_DN59128_c0_g1~~TRINITY_DN59128_c0_g1_i1.p1  ORF type:complete len:340 (+),score=60.80 TRINITY_DN59128_c0_g1_i1:28-1047(+)